MKNAIKIFLAIIIYLLSAIHNYNWFHIAFGKEGRWCDNSADIGAVIITFVPFVNTIAIIVFPNSPYKDNRNNYFNELFNIKK